MASSCFDRGATIQELHLCISSFNYWVQYAVGSIATELHFASQFVANHHTVILRTLFYEGLWHGQGVPYKVPTSISVHQRGNFTYASMILGIDHARVTMYTTTTNEIDLGGSFLMKFSFRSMRNICLSISL